MLAADRPPPPYDPELVAAFPGLPPDVFESLIVDHIAAKRAMRTSPPLSETLAGRAITHAEFSAPTESGDHDVLLSLFRRAGEEPTAARQSRLGVFTIHGGGMVMGDRFSGLETALEWVEEFGAVAVSVEYRLAPEHRDPVPLEDCFTGLRWVAAHAAELGFDPDCLLLHGGSAGGGLAAGVALLARDRDGPALLGQVLSYPMLDDRNDTVSSRQFAVGGLWDQRSNETGWSALLGDRRGSQGVSPYSAPSRATDLSGLPPTYIEVGSAEVFRDEAVAYASRLWACGGDAELHVWPGGFHGSDRRVPGATISLAARSTRTDWLRRIVQRLANQ